MGSTHVFIVDNNTLKHHLENLFVGTGMSDKVIDFNSLGTTKLHHATENNLLGMIADFSRVKIGDKVVFYLQQNSSKDICDGKFFGIFEINSLVFLDNNDDKQFLKKELGKSLTFRATIKPYKVYAKGVTEWEALDEIKNIISPNQMLWSLIYRKLKGNRGNTMITNYEFKRLNQLLKDKNQRIKIADDNFSFNLKKQTIESISTNTKYVGRKDEINILPRLIAKYDKKQQFETHLQAYILQNIKNINLFNDENIEWLGNEVSCGVGMQRIDIMLSVNRNNEKVCIPIELKSTEFYHSIIRQIQRYVDWVQQYYIPNHISDIEPMIICREKKDKTCVISDLKKFNKSNINVLKIRYIEFNIKKDKLTFNEVNY
jgi:predicted RNA-binding protein